MRRRSATGSMLETFSPSISSAPLEASTMRLIMRSSVVLPQPLDPTSTVVRCEGITRLKPSTASVPSANLFEMERNSITVLDSSGSIGAEVSPSVLPVKQPSPALSAGSPCFPGTYADGARMLRWPLPAAARALGRRRGRGPSSP